MDGKGSGRRPGGLSGPAAGWILLAGAVGLASSAIFSSWLRLDRATFVLGHAILVGAFVAIYVAVTGMRPMVQLRRHWRAGAAAGVLLGAFLAHGVSAQPASPRPVGAGLGYALFWLGGVYGAVDALLLNVVPVLVVYGSRPGEDMRRAAARLRTGGLALLASLAATAAYHVGFAEFRGPELLQPLIGNAIITAGYLLTGSPLAAVLAHIIMHGAAVLHGMDTTMQLPPHY